MTTAIIEEEVRRLLAVMGFADAEVACTLEEVALPAGHHLRITIQAADAGRFLIGVHGAHLRALHHIIRALVKRSLPSPFRLTVDVNNYLASREVSLAQLAAQAAQTAGRTGRAIVLPPMDAASRRSIHTSLAARTDVNTESLGEEPRRSVVVRPIVN